MAFGVLAAIDTKAHEQHLGEACCEITKRTSDLKTGFTLRTTKQRVVGNDSFILASLWSRSGGRERGRGVTIVTTSIS